MSATSEANSLESWFALGKQAAKGTAGTTLYKTLATVSSIGATYDEREPPLEHPAVSTRATARKSAIKRPSYMSNAKATFILRPKFIVPALLAAGFQVTTTNNTTHYTHVCTLGSSAAHKWMTSAWSVEESDGAFILRGVDMRATSLNLAISPDQIEGSIELRGLTLDPMSGSPTYVTEQADEIAPWNMTRTTLSMNSYDVVERIRSMEFAVTNTMREDDRAVGETARTTMAQQSIDISLAIGEVNVSDDIVEAFHYGATGGSTVDLDAVTGAIDILFESDDNISGASVPYSLQIAIPSVSYTMDTEPEANGDGLITAGLTAYMIDDSSTPITVTVVNNVSSY
jgi:hypothetical protein